MTRLADDREAHGALWHGQLAVLVPRGGPAELPQLLRHSDQERHGGQACGQRGQRRHQVQTPEEHRDERPEKPKQVSAFL